MNEHQDTSSPRRGLARRWIVAIGIVAALGATGLAGASFAGDGMGMGMHGHGGHEAMDPAKAAAHIDKMVEHILSDGTPQQKARLAEIAKAAFAELHPMRAQFKAAHQRAHDLLMQPVIDRAALEQVRAEQIARMDTVSKRILTAVEDAADVLTPAQRERFAEHMKKRMMH